jgi:hypothetical protein
MLKDEYYVKREECGEKFFNLYILKKKKKWTWLVYEKRLKLEFLVIIPEDSSNMVIQSIRDEPQVKPDTFCFSNLALFISSFSREQL